MRYAISSQEEMWVKACYKFFERHGHWDWYKVDQQQAFHEMMKDGQGAINPTDLKQRIKELYQSVGI